MSQPIITCTAIEKAFTFQPLFSALDLGISAGDRLGIVGPNGSGKSTLLRIIARLEEPDRGVVAQRRDTRACYVEQQTSLPPDRTVLSLVREAALAVPRPPEESEKTVHLTLNRAGFEEPEAPAGTLSGGWQKRLAIACALVQTPDVLLLDEPTNHLDLEGILWLEDVLTGARFAWALVTHDRYFLNRTAGRILELNRIYPSGYFIARGNYSRYLEQKEACLDAQDQQRRSLAGKVRRETEWLNRGPKARTTKARARIDQAQELMAELAQTDARLRDTKSGIEFSASERKTKKLIEVKAAAKSFGERRIVEHLNLLLSPGLRIGILGLNGSGKTTLLKLIAQQIRPDRGSVIHATDLQLAYFDQNREQLNPEWTLKRALVANGESVMFQGRPIHVTSWARRFQFRPDQLDLPAGRLSGGEQARLAIARLMLQPADVLLLDEPTNDLDIPALEALEESLLEFSGALVLVTHDRYLLNTVCHGFIGLDGRGGCHYYAGYEQWQAVIAGGANKRSAKAPKAQNEKSGRPARDKKKLSYLEQREYDQIESKILAAEAELEDRQKAIEDPAISVDPQKLTAAVELWQRAQAEVEALYARWAELEELQERLSSSAS